MKSTETPGTGVLAAHVADAIEAVTRNTDYDATAAGTELAAHAAADGSTCAWSGAESEDGRCPDGCQLTVTSVTRLYKDIEFSLLGIPVPMPVPRNQLKGATRRTHRIPCRNHHGPPTTLCLNKVFNGHVVE